MKLLRKKRGLTQEQLGNLVDTTQSYISRIENGYIKTLTIYKLEKLSEVFGLESWELLKILEKNRANY
jgi:repressor LexA